MVKLYTIDILNEDGSISVAKLSDRFHKTLLKRGIDTKTPVAMAEIDKSKKVLEKRDRAKVKRDMQKKQRQEEGGIPTSSYVMSRPKNIDDGGKQDTGIPAASSAMASPTTLRKIPVMTEKQLASMPRPKDINDGNKVAGNQATSSNKKAYHTWVAVDPENGRTPYNRQLTHAEYQYIIRRGLMIRPNVITEKTLEELPYILKWERMPEGTNTMRINLSKNQIHKLKYGRNLSIDPDQVDTIGEGTIIRHLSDKNRDTLVLNRRLHRKTKLSLSDKELLGTWAVW
jgi:hypothetical protein